MNLQPDPIATLWRSRWDRAQGRPVVGSWAEFLSELARARVWRGRLHEGWAPGVFSPAERSWAHVRAVTALVLGVRTEGDGRSTVGALGGALALLYRPPWPPDERWVLALPLAAPTAREGAGRAAQVVQRIALGVGARVSIEEASATFLELPASRPGEPPRAEVLEGDLLDLASIAHDQARHA